MPTIVVIFIWNEYADAFGVQQVMHIYRRGQWVSFFPGRHVLILKVMHWSFLYLYVYFDTFVAVLIWLSYFFMTSNVLRKT